MKRRTQEYVERMREKPRHEQQKHAGLIAVAATGALFLLWLPLFAGDLQNGLQGDVARTEKTDVRLFRSGVASVTDGFRQGFDVLRGTATGYGSVEYRRDADEVPADETFGEPLKAQPVEWSDEE